VSNLSLVRTWTPHLPPNKFCYNFTTTCRNKASSASNPSVTRALPTAVNRISKYPVEPSSREPSEITGTSGANGNDRVQPFQHDLPQRFPGSDNQRCEYQMTFKKCYIFGLSTANIRTERFWLQGLQECLGSWRDLFTLVEEARVYMKDWLADQLVILLSSCF
jgi:hypothetical protein